MMGLSSRKDWLRWLQRTLVHLDLGGRNPVHRQVALLGPVPCASRCIGAKAGASPVFEASPQAGISSEPSESSERRESAKKLSR